VNESKAMLGGKRPECFVFDDVQTEASRFGAVLVEYLGPNDSQAIFSH
jgi:hypothetical protein